jgi:hypothetical protein
MEDHPDYAPRNDVGKQRDMAVDQNNRYKRYESDWVK